jgi:hypothetical protein
LLHVKQRVVPRQIRRISVKNRVAMRFAEPGGLPMGTPRSGALPKMCAADFPYGHSMRYHSSHDD